MNEGVRCCYDTGVNMQCLATCKKIKTHLYTRWQNGEKRVGKKRKPTKTTWTEKQRKAWLENNKYIVKHNTYSEIICKEIQVKAKTWHHVVKKMNCMMNWGNRTSTKECYDCRGQRQDYEDSPTHNQVNKHVMMT